jgi:hypothetical protein
MTAFPDTRHPTKQHRDKKGPIGDRNHSRPHRANKGEVIKSQGFLRRHCISLSLTALIFKPLLAASVVFEYLALVQRVWYKKPVESIL